MNIFWESLNGNFAWLICFIFVQFGNLQETHKYKSVCICVFLWMLTCTDALLQLLPLLYFTHLGEDLHYFLHYPILTYP